MKYGRFITLLFIFSSLFSCNVSDYEPSVNSDNTLAPKRIENLGFSLTVESVFSQFDGTLLPKFSELITLEANASDVFVKSDLYDEWDYQFSYKYDELDGNSIILELSKDSEVVGFELVFTHLDSGTWQLILPDSDQQVVASGSFYYSIIVPPVKYDYQGHIETKISISSKRTNFDYPYRVYLPKQYFEQPSKNFPIIYATDGQWVFWSFSQFLDVNSYPVILVGIEQGKGNRRQVDYLLPGSSDYVEFFKTEFIDEIERKYRVDPKQRSIQGASYGGLVVSHFLFEHERLPNFQNYISADGSYWQGVSAYRALEQDANLRINKEEPVNLFLHSATIAGNHQYVVSYRDRLEQLNIKHLNIYFQSFDVTHVEIAYPSFISAVERIFSPH